METQSQNPFASSGLFVSTANVWTPFKMSFEGFAGAGKTLTMCCIALGIWEAEGKTGNIVLVDTERSAKFIVPFFHQFGLIEGKNFFVTHTRDLQRWGQILAMAESVRGTIMLTDTVSHVYEEMMIQFERDNGRKVKYPQDAMIIKPMWKEKFSTPFLKANNCHLLFTGRAAWEYTMQEDEDTGKKSFNATGVKMRGDNELAYEPDVVVLMERLQKITTDGVETARCATILKDRSRLIDGQQFIFKAFEPGKDKEGQARVWQQFEPVFKLLASGNQTAQPQTEADKAMGPLFQKGNGEAWYQQKLRAERTVEEIKGVFEQWGLGGTGAVEKAIRANLYMLIFNNRTTAALAEMKPDELQAGFEVIEFLARYVARNMEFVEKMFKSGEHEKLHAYLADAQKEYLEHMAQAPTLESQSDQIPDLDVPTEPKPTAKQSAQELAFETIHSGIMNALTQAQADELFNVTYAGQIAAMELPERKRLNQARLARKRQIKNGGQAALV